MKTIILNKPGTIKIGDPVIRADGKYFLSIMWQNIDVVSRHFRSNSITAANGEVSFELFQAEINKLGDFDQQIPGKLTFRLFSYDNRKDVLTGNVSLVEISGSEEDNTTENNG